MKKLTTLVLVCILPFLGFSQGSKQPRETTLQAFSNPLESQNMYPELLKYIASLQRKMEEIPEERKDHLREIAHFVQSQKEANLPANLTFICTHNSRRSHMSQIWAATAAAYYGLEEGLHVYSGGTEVTAFNPRAVAAMERAGFSISNPGGTNPHYQVRYAAQTAPITCFSKKYDDHSNPHGHFASVMTCSEAERNCPFIPGASLYVAIPYTDPKESDSTPEESSVYDQRCQQIAAEMFYLMSQAKS
jgi:arsenate reductase (thioredoxin)